MEKQKNRLIPVIFIAIICGLAAGITGEIVTRVYILKDFSVPYFNNEVELADLDYNRASLIIRDAKKVVVNQDVKINETISSLRPVLVGVFKNIGTDAQALAATTTKSTDLSSINSDYYQLDQPVMMGLAVTSDGWIAASLPQPLDKEFNPEDHVVITSDRKIYKIDQVSDFKDLPGNLIFFHLAGASNLSVKKIASRQEMSLGQSVIAVNDFNNVLLTSLSSFKKVAAVSSSDSLNARFSLAGAISDDFKNSFVFDLAGNLVAVIGSDKVVIPAVSYSHYWQSFFKKGAALQPSLGVNYIDLSTAKVLGVSLEKGAWLKDSTTSLAVEKGSPAELAGLRSGDVITWINNQEINAANDLSDIIASFNPDDSITVVYFRDGEEKTVSVKLGSK